MKDKLYLLDITTLKSEHGNGESGGFHCDGADDAHNVQQQYIQQALERLDACRRKKAENIKQKHAKAASVGAGLLLQWAAQTYERSLGQSEAVEMQDLQYIGKSVADSLTRKSDKTEPVRKALAVEEFTVEELLAQLGEPFPLTYRYGENGKPYWKEIPLFFSLSHSGDYVICAVSEQEIGADIQELKGNDWMKTARRYFAPQELQAIQAQGTEEERRKLFFRLWTRKEAWGKLTGQGVAPVLSKNVLEAEDVNWLELMAPDGYEIAACVQGRNLWEDC